MVVCKLKTEIFQLHIFFKNNICGALLKDYRLHPGWLYSLTILISFLGFFKLLISRNDYKTKNSQVNEAPLIVKCKKTTWLCQCLAWHPKIKAQWTGSWMEDGGVRARNFCKFTLKPLIFTFYALTVALHRRVRLTRADGFTRRGLCWHPSAGTPVMLELTGNFTHA